MEREAPRHTQRPLPLGAGGGRTSMFVTPLTSHALMSSWLTPFVSLPHSMAGWLAPSQLLSNKTVLMSVTDCTFHVEGAHLVKGSFLSVLRGVPSAAHHLLS